MNKDEANKRTLAVSFSTESLPGTQVPPEKLKSVISGIMLKDNEVIDKRIDEMINGYVDESINQGITVRNESGRIDDIMAMNIEPDVPWDFTRGSLSNIDLNFERAFRTATLQAAGVVMHPSMWRGVKRIMLKNKAKRRARARMRSRGYVAHGRHR